jgi:hypothetical protein
MGKSMPTYRNLLDGFCDELQPFRRTAIRECQPAFDRVLEHAWAHAASAGQVSPTDPEKLALFSICVGLQHEVLELREELGLPTDEPLGKGKQQFES